MKTTRQRILEYLEVKGAASARDIGRGLHLTTANIRHHLAILAQQGLVEVVDVTLDGRAGRPARRYASAGRMSAHNLDGLANALLQELAACTSHQEHLELLKRIARRMAAKKGQPERGFTQRLFRAVQCLNEMNYTARWEARPVAPRLILGHCPYFNIVSEHPELCQMDAALLEALLEVPIVQIARLERTSVGLHQCVFQVGERHEPEG